MDLSASSTVIMSSFVVSLAKCGGREGSIFVGFDVTEAGNWRQKYAIPTEEGILRCYCVSLVIGILGGTGDWIVL